MRRVFATVLLFGVLFSCSAITGPAAAVAGAPAPTGDEPVPFRFYKDVQIKTLKQENIIAIPLDSDVFAATGQQFPDVRVIDSAGHEMPFVLQKATDTRTETTRKNWLARNVSLHPLAEGGLEIRIRLDKDDSLPNGIRFVTPLKNYEQRVRVFGSDDGETWQPLVSEAVIFDYSRYMDVSQRELPLPENTHRRFRIVIDDVTAEQESQLLELTRRLRGGEEAERTERITIQRRPFRIDRIEFWHKIVRERVKGEKTTSYPVVEFHVEEQPKEHETWIEVRTRREPLTSLAIQTASRNFSRRAVVQVPVTKGIRTEWREVGSATVSRIDFRDLHREQLAVTFSEQREETYRLVLDNRDSLPLEITGIEAEGNVYHLLLFAEPNASYRLYYGDAREEAERQEPPRYDTAALRASLHEGYEPLVASLGEQQTNPDVAQPSAFAARSILNNPLVLGGVICVLVAVLAWGLYRAAGRIDTVPKE